MSFRDSRCGRSARSHDFFATAFAATVFFVGVGCSQSGSQPVSSAETLRLARIALVKGDCAEAERLVRLIPQVSSEWQVGQLIAGETATKEGQLHKSLSYYLAAAEDESTTDGQLGLFSAAEIYKELGELESAEELYRRVLILNPTNGITNSRMALLLSLTNRRWEALDNFFELIKGGEATFRELGMAADVSRQIRQPDLLARFVENNPDGIFVRLACAADAFHEGEPRAIDQLEALVKTRPSFVSAQAMLGELLVDLPGTQRFLEWHESLPATAEQSPDIWYVRGLWARRQADLPTATKCLWQSVIRMPFHRRGFCALAQVLTTTNDPDSESVRRYCDLLRDVSQEIDLVLTSDGKNEAAVRKVAELMEQLGRIWEACAWAVEARRRFPASQWPDALLGRLSHRLQPGLPRIDPVLNPVTGRLASAVSEFERLVENTSRMNIAPAVVTWNAAITFEDTNAIQFRYYNADDPDTKGVRVFEQTGGGVGIIDFDLDGSPDVFLTQGTEWVSGKDNPETTSAFQDCLFRNVRGERFEYSPSAVDEQTAGYGQGCAVGDFNNDGLPDLYVANVGKNNLYQNQGDGTFLDVTDQSSIDDEAWTASAMLCDLNADGLPDLFDVNYVMGTDVYTKICQDRACSPSVFEGAPDRLLINLGDGDFRQMEDATPQVNSKGLGIIAFENAADRRPSLFISNDQVANFLLDNRPANNPENISLNDSATFNGLAFNDQGLPMACMGVAMDDLDGNGLLDLFVTNFQDESNTVYLQDTVGLYVDATKAAGLQAVSLPYTGWGTQALDADLDGRPDLIVANGHVDDGREYGGDYHQRPQFFHNVGGRFEELSPDQAGSYFSGMYLGRGVARVDWNLDGRPEFIVSNINANVSVLKNTTKDCGHSASFRLVASTTARDAIGTRVTVTYSGREITRQLTAGDGYMASNERLLQFGLGDATVIDSVRIQWPSKNYSELSSIPADSTVTIVEGLPTATFQAHHDFGSLRVNVQP